MVIDVDANLVERYLLELARHGAYGETGVWRTVYSPEWVAAQDQVAGWFAEAGLDVRRGSNDQTEMIERGPGGFARRATRPGLRG